jgi:hypothetical protein
MVPYEVHSMPPSVTILATLTPTELELLSEIGAEAIAAARALRDPCDPPGALGWNQYARAIRGLRHRRARLGWRDEVRHGYIAFVPLDGRPFELAVGSGEIGSPLSPLALTRVREGGHREGAILDTGTHMAAHRQGALAFSQQKAVPPKTFFLVLAQTAQEARAEVQIGEDVANGKMITTEAFSLLARQASAPPSSALPQAVVTDFDIEWPAIDLGSGNLKRG